MRLSKGAPIDLFPSPPYDLEALRADVPILQRLVPMNHCSQAPPTTRTRAAAERYLSSWAGRGMDWDAWMAEVEAARRSFAHLIGADPDEVAIASSVSQALSALASALEFKHGRNRVISSDAEFPTALHVWGAQERRGAELVRTPVMDGAPSTAAYSQEIDGRSAVVSMPLGYYQTGALLDVEAVTALAREAGALTFVDAYQALGAVPMDVRALGIDALASGCLKYLMGLPGLAFLYVRRELAETLEPGVTGWFGRRDPFAFTAHLDWADGTRRFDSGTPPIFEAHVCRAGIETLLDVGVQRVREWTMALSAALVAGGRNRGLTVMGPEDPQRRAPTTAFAVEVDSHAVETHMRGAGVIASARGPALRLAPHFYSSLDDVERALNALEGAVASLS